MSFLSPITPMKEGPALSAGLLSSEPEAVSLFKSILDASALNEPADLKWNSESTWLNLLPPIFS